MTAHALQGYRGNLPGGGNGRLHLQAHPGRRSLSRDRVPWSRPPRTQASTKYAPADNQQEARLTPMPCSATSTSRQGLLREITADVAVDRCPSALGSDARRRHRSRRQSAGGARPSRSRARPASSSPGEAFEAGLGSARADGPRRHDGSEPKRFIRHWSGSSRASVTTCRVEPRRITDEDSDRRGRPDRASPA